MDFGEWELKSYKELSTDIRFRDSYQAWIDSGGTLAFPSGESRKEFCKRSICGFERALTQALDCLLYTSRIHHVSLSLRRCQPLATRTSFFVRLWLLQETMPTMIWQEVMMIHGFHSLRHQESLKAMNHHHFLPYHCWHGLLQQP